MVTPPDIDSRFRNTYPPWSLIHIFTVSVTVLLETEAFFGRHNNAEECYPQKSTQQDNPRGARYAHAHQRQKAAKVYGVSQNTVGSSGNQLIWWSIGSANGNHDLHSQAQDEN